MPSIGHKEEASLHLAPSSASTRLPDVSRSATLVGSTPDKSKAWGQGHDEPMRARQRANAWQTTDAEKNASSATLVPAASESGTLISGSHGSQLVAKHAASLSPAANGPAARPSVFSRITNLLVPKGNFQLAKSVLIGACIMLALAVVTGNPVVAAIAIGMVAIGMVAWYIGDPPRSAPARPVASAISMPAPSHSGSLAGERDHDHDDLQLGWSDSGLSAAHSDGFLQEEKERREAMSPPGPVASTSTRLHEEHPPWPADRKTTA